LCVPLAGIYLREKRSVRLLFVEGRRASVPSILGSVPSCITFTLNICVE